MTTLVQKHLFKGLQQFEIHDDHIDVRIKAPFKDEERLTVMLTVLNPEPVIDKTHLHFNSRVNGEPLLSLFLGKPDTQQFNTFVSTVKEMATNAFSSFAGLRGKRPTGALDGYLPEEPEDFDDFNKDQIISIRRELDTDQINLAIRMLKEQLDENDIADFLSVLERLSSEPENETDLQEAITAFNALGPYQGAVLTYAPYINTILTDSPARMP